MKRKESDICNESLYFTLHYESVKLYIIAALSVILFFIFFTSCIDVIKKRSGTKIDVWYGKEQTFGRNGIPQRQINIPGNIRSEIKNIQAYYTINNGHVKNYLTLGCDMHRLAETGDFNIDIERKMLKEGENIITIYVIHEDMLLKKQKIKVNILDGRKCDLPWYVNWKDVRKISDAVDIVDGKWILTSSGIRTDQVYYDRVICFGDSSWVNYEVETTVVFHGYRAPSPGPPTYNVAHAAIASRWPGHDKDSLQPDRKWFPLGATSEFRITNNYDSCRWRVFDGQNFRKEQPFSEYRTIEPEVVYKMKHRVEDISDTVTMYSVKLWKASAEEPVKWDLQAIEKIKIKDSGSACLIAHHTDVTFGNISVNPLKK